MLTCNERKKEVAVAQNIAGKQIDKTFLFDKVLVHLITFFKFMV